MQVTQVLNAVAVDVADLGFPVTEPQRLIRVHDADRLRLGPVFAIQVVANRKPAGVVMTTSVRRSPSMSARRTSGSSKVKLGTVVMGTAVAKVLSVELPAGTESHPCRS